jgi:4-azaleucine resistance transporter AzlC
MTSLTLSPPDSRSHEFWAGVRAEIPLLVGVFPFGMIFGVLALGAGIPSGIAQAMSSIIFAGASQFVMAQLVGSGTPALVIVLTIAVVNLRHALYSASISPYVKRLSGSWKAVLAYLLTDEAYAVAILKYEQDGETPSRHWYFLGAGLALWTCWQISTALGIFLGAVIPAHWSLDFTLALTFIALVVPALKDKPAAGAALVAAVTAVLAYGLPYKLGLILAALVGILAGLLLEGRK